MRQKSGVLQKMTKMFTFSAMVKKENEQYVSSCLELEISS